MNVAILQSLLILTFYKEGHCSRDGLRHLYDNIISVLLQHMVENEKVYEMGLSV